MEWWNDANDEKEHFSIGIGVGIGQLQCDKDDYDAEPVFPAWRYDLHDCHEDDWNLRRFKEAVGF